MLYSTHWIYSCNRYNQDNGVLLFTKMDFLRFNNNNDCPHAAFPSRLWQNRRHCDWSVLEKPSSFTSFRSQSRNGPTIPRRLKANFYVSMRTKTGNDTLSSFHSHSINYSYKLEGRSTDQVLDITQHSDDHLLFNICHLSRILCRFQRPPRINKPSTTDNTDLYSNIRLRSTYRPTTDDLLPPSTMTPANNSFFNSPHG